MNPIASTMDVQERGARRAHLATLVAAAVFALGVTFAAGSANADNAFKYAFKDEFGRIVAHQVAAIAPLVLFGPAVHAVHQAPRHYDTRGDYGHYGRREYRHYDRHDARPRSHRRDHYDRHAYKRHKNKRHHYKRHNKHHRSCGHRY